MYIFIKEHGRTVIYCVTAFFLLCAVFSFRLGEDTGFIQASYGKAKEDMTYTDVSFYADTVKTVMARKRPEIIYTYQKIRLGEEVNLDHMFLARDADGKSAKVEIVDILNDVWESILDEKSGDDTKKFLFPAAGIYTVKVKAEDAEKKTASRQYKILVSGT